MLQKLRLTDHTRTTLILESTLCEVLGIVSTLAFVQIEKASTVQPTVIVGNIIASFVVAAILGVVAALIWSSVLKIIRRVDNSIFCTPAFVCIVYAAAELLGYSGPVATLIFGLVLGNVREIKILQKIPSLQNEMMALTHQEKDFFAALVFFLKSLFFVYVGISMQFDSIFYVLAALVLTAWTMITRLIVTRLTMPLTMSVYDLSITSVMVPKGLAAAVLASLVTQSGIPAAQVIRELAFGVILFSICAVALMTFLIERNVVTGLYTFIFPHKRVPVPAVAAVPGQAIVTDLNATTNAQAEIKQNTPESSDEHS